MTALVGVVTNSKIVDLGSLRMLVVKIDESDVSVSKSDEKLTLKQPQNLLSVNEVSSRICWLKLT